MAMSDIDDQAHELRRLMIDMEALDTLEVLFRCERRGVCLMNLWLASEGGTARCTCRALFTEWYIIEEAPS
jgi:hypothetical protein